MATTSYISQQAAIFQDMVSYIQNPSNWSDGIPKLTNFTTNNPLYVLLSAVATAIDNNGYAIFMARQAAYITTATGSDLDNKAADYGITRKPAAIASGIFTFTKLMPSASLTVIPAGTLISTIPDGKGNVITFVTNADATLPGGQTQVTVQATCKTSGSIGNLSANTQLLVSSAVPGIDGVQLNQSISTGVDIETDDQLRARTLGAFASLARGTAAWYQETALSIPGVQSATVVPQNRGAGTVDIFIVGANNTIPSANLQAQVQSVINAGRPVTDDAKEQVPTILTINVTTQIHVLPGYDPTITSQYVETAQINYINNLGCGAGTLGYVYAAQLISVVMSVPGVANATTTFTDTAVGQYQLPQAGNITVTTA